MTDPTTLREALIQELGNVKMLCNAYLEPADTYQLDLVERTTIAEHLAPKLEAAQRAGVDAFFNRVGLWMVAKKMNITGQPESDVILQEAQQNAKDAYIAALRDGSEG